MARWRSEQTHRTANTTFKGLNPLRASNLLIKGRNLSFFYFCVIIELGDVMINNIYWVGNLNVIGGVETFMFELAKQFQDYDFVIYYNSIPQNQLKRLQKYVKCVKYKGEKLKCRKFFCNYDISIIDNVEAEEYIQIVHCVFKYNKLKPHTHDKITKYYAVGKEACESFKEITGKKCEVLHNILNIDKPNKILKLISATRIASDKGKIVERMQKLVNEIEANDIPYQWLIFTNGQHLVNGKGIIYCQPNLDIRDFIAECDYLVQLSDTEAFCYSVLESLYLNTPVIVTPIPCFDEMGIQNRENGYILDFDMKEIPIFDIYNKIPKFNYQPLKNEWEDMIIKVKGNYKEEKKMRFKVKALISFNDLEENKKRVVGEEFECSKVRCDYLLEHKAIEIVEEVKENSKEEVELNEFGNPVGTRELKEEKTKSTKKKKSSKK